MTGKKETLRNTNPKRQDKGELRSKIRNKTGDDLVHSLVMEARHTGGKAENRKIGLAAGVLQSDIAPPHEADYLTMLIEEALGRLRASSSKTQTQ